MGRFSNPHIRDIKRTLWDLILWRFGFYAEKRPRTLPPENFQYPHDYHFYDRNLPSAMWIGHSTYLIHIDGLTFLTDPVFSNYCSPVPFHILKRREAPALDICEIPPIDIVLISHNHYDHLDRKSILALHRMYPNILWVVPRGVKEWFSIRSIHNVVELDWGAVYKGQCKIHAVAAQHFSGRSLWDKNKTLWCGYVVECQNKRFYFVGDTGYNPVDFRQIGEKWPDMDLCLIPIGTYVPEKFMQPVHISPQEAVNIHSDVHSKFSLGMHWKTFCLSEEPVNLPPYDLFLTLKERNLPLDSFLPVEPGRYINW
jgi:N-acyl-phosphatidylethanolamine-hydrolysing phospholipase D